MEFTVILMESYPLQLICYEGAVLDTAISISNLKMIWMNIMPISYKRSFTIKSHGCIIETCV